MTDTTTTGRKETPDARLLLPADAPRSDWLQARRGGITATDVVALMGLSSYRTAVDVWTDKLFPQPDGEAGEAAVWGNRLEDPVAQEWASRNNVKVRRIGIVANETEPWQLASLDRIVLGCPDGRCALEVKTRNLFVGPEWERGVPTDVEAQARWQLVVSGLDHVHVAALIGGQRLIEHRVDRDTDAEERLVTAARIVWDAVLSETMPDMPVELWTSALLDQRNPERSGEVEVDENVVTTLDQYQRTLATIKTLDAEKERLRTLLVGALGDAETATSVGRSLYSYKTSTRRTFNGKTLAELYPDTAADERLYTTTTSRTFRVSTRKDNPND